MADIRENNPTTIQKKLDTKLLPLDFGPEAKKNIKTLAEVIHRMICLKEKTWYIKPEGLTFQRHGCRRSTEDIYQVAKKYVKNLTLEKVAQSLRALETARLIYSGYCITVCRRVYMNNSVHTRKIEAIKKIVKI